MTMQRPVGVPVLAVLSLIWGFRALSAVPPGLGQGNLAGILGTILAALSFLTAYGLFQMQFWSLKVYAIWVSLVIVVGSLIEYQCGTSFIAIVVAMSLLAVACLAVGFYMRSTLIASG